MWIVGSKAKGAKKKTAKKKVVKKAPRKPPASGLTKSPNPNIGSKEKFICDLVVEAKLPKRTAMAEAGLNPTHTTRFFNRPNIAAYIEAKRAVAVAVNKHRQGMIIAELQKIAFANLGDYLTFGPDGVKLKTSKLPTDDQKAALSEVAETISMAGGNVKMKFHSKTKALETLAKIEGMLVDKLKLSGSVEVTPTEEYILALAEIEKKAKLAAAETEKVEKK